jgi:hypothetical protein
LDGMLDILLDVLKGAGKTSKSGTTTERRKEFGNWEPEMDDPSLANNLLFELSESEDDEH